MFRRLSFILSAGKRRLVPINCRKPTEEDVKLSTREKLDWVGYILILTIVPVGIQLWQFSATSATRVNADIMDELARRRQSDNVDQTTAPVKSSDMTL